MRIPRLLIGEIPQTLLCHIEIIPGVDIYVRGILVGCEISARILSSKSTFLPYVGCSLLRYELQGEMTMKRFTAVMKNLWKNESGQGATEYVLLVVVVVALVVLFRDRITSALVEKLSQLSGDITGFTGSGQ